MNWPHKDNTAWTDRQRERNLHTNRYAAARQGKLDFFSKKKDSNPFLPVLCAVVMEDSWIVVCCVGCHHHPHYHRICCVVVSVQNKTKIISKIDSNRIKSILYKHYQDNG